MDANLARLLSDDESSDTIISVSSSSSTSSFRSSVSSSSVESETIPPKKPKLASDELITKLNEIINSEVGDNDKVYKVKELLERYTERIGL